MQTNILGYPRIGSRRELKKACENFWAGNISEEELLKAGAAIRQQNWTLQNEAGIFNSSHQTISLSTIMYWIQHSWLVPFLPVMIPYKNNKMALYFAMARGYQQEGKDITAMEMTKWFDTNYHYIVPEFTRNQHFSLFYNKALGEFREALEQGFETKPVLIGPVSYLFSGKEKEAGFHRLDLQERLLPMYILSEGLASGWCCRDTTRRTIPGDRYR